MFFAAAIFIIHVFPAHAIVTDYPYPKNKRVLIRAEILAGCMAGVIGRDKPFTLQPKSSYGTNKNGPQAGAPCAFDLESAFLYITANRQRCDFETGQEPQLREWILQQTDNSVHPLSLFAKALALNEGKAFDAIFTIHQLLRNEARWQNTNDYFYDSSPEKARTFWAKMVDIRGDLGERGGESQGDHRGSWYRFWAFMLYRMKLAEGPRSPEDRWTCYRQLIDLSKSKWADFKGSLLSLGAEMFKYVIDITVDPKVYKSDDDRPGKARINSAGVTTAQWLIERLDKGDLLDPASAACAPEKYLLEMAPYEFKPKAD